MEKKSRIPALQASVDEVVESDAWDLQPGENTAWYARFDQYRLLGPNRTLREVYRRERNIYRKSKQHAIHLGSVKEWNIVSASWEWTPRAEAWDMYMQMQQEMEAQETFGEGLSLIHKRIDKLKAMAKKLEEHILDPKMTRVSPYIMEQYRGLLDDIAKEMGQRSKEVRVTGAGGGPIMIETQWGRGGSATTAANQLWNGDSPKLITEVTEVTDESAT